MCRPIMYYFTFQKNKFSEATKNKSASAFSMNQTDENNEASYLSAEDMASDLHRGLDDLTNLPLADNGVPLHPGGDVSDNDMFASIY